MIIQESGYIIGDMVSIADGYLPSKRPPDLGGETTNRHQEYSITELIRTIGYNVPEGSSVLEIGCGSGSLLNSLKPGRGVGIDAAAEMISRAKELYPQHEFHCMDPENISLQETFDYIVIHDTLEFTNDVQKVFREIKKVCRDDARIIIIIPNFSWRSVLSPDRMNGKERKRRLNWLNREDIAGLLFLEGYDVIKQGRKILFPFSVPVVSRLVNKYVSPLPLWNLLCLTSHIIARPLPPLDAGAEKKTVSVIIPARNEKGNIRNMIKRLPVLGRQREVIFVEGHSTDGTLDEIKSVCEDYRGALDIKCEIQDGTGKADAVRKGFSAARGEILMVLDADLTVPPETLPKFYEAIVSGKGELIIGSRLVYPLEKESMRFLNRIGNKFFSLMFSWILGQRLKDTLCGAKVLSKSNYEKIAAGRNFFGELDPFGDFDLIFGSSKLNLKIVEIPVRYQARKYGETNISRFRHGWLLLKMTLYGLSKIKFY